MKIGFMILNVSELMNAGPNKSETGNFKQRSNLNSVRCLYQVWECTVRRNTGEVVLIVEYAGGGLNLLLLCALYIPLFQVFVWGFM